MGCLSSIKSFFRKIDLFQTNELLRFKSEATYSSATGGFITFLLIIGFLIAFVRNAVNVFRK